MTTSSTRSHARTHTDSLSFDRSAAGSLKSTLNLVSSFSTTLVSLGRGTHVKRKQGQRPEKMLELYDIENSPFCRLVREVVTELDLDVIIYPCPKKGQRFRPTVKAMGGKEQFPFLHDPNTGKQLYESIDIIRYLINQYGDASAVNLLFHHAIKIPTSIASSLLRYGKGTTAQSTRLTDPAPSSVHSTSPQSTQGAPLKRLQLYSFEASPCARKVRECLCELELSYELISVGKHEWTDYLLSHIRKRLLPNHVFVGAKRQKMSEEAGRVMVPYLIDPNNDTQLFHSDKICSYLREKYGKQGVQF